MRKTDPNTGHPLYDVELFTDRGGRLVVEDLHEVDALFLLNSVGDESDDNTEHFATGDLNQASESFAAISFDQDRVVLAVVRR